MDYKHILRQKPVFDVVIKNLRKNSDKIEFCKLIDLLDHLFLTSEPDTDLWYDILQDHTQHLSPRIIENLNDDLWLIISGDSVFTRPVCPHDASFIRKYVDKLNWELYCSSYALPESIICEFSEKVDWYAISSLDLTDEFVHEFSDRLDWNVISEVRDLSDDFIREFESKLNWEIVTIHQCLSKEIVTEFSHKINFYTLLNSLYCPSNDFIADMLTKAYHD